ncbi:MAG: NUDIX domain-containing protein [Patescibacteria group bacterium]
MMEKPPEPVSEQVRKVKIEGENVDVVVGAYITRTNEAGRLEVLLVQGPSGVWYFPGGKIREGEKFGDGLARELEEELGVKYDGDFHEFHAGSYEIKGKKLAIINVTPTDSYKWEPKKQEGDAIKDFVWTDDPLQYNLTDQARALLEAKFTETKELPKSEKISNPR